MVAGVFAGMIITKGRNMIQNTKTQIIIGEISNHLLEIDVYKNEHNQELPSNDQNFWQTINSDKYKKDPISINGSKYMIEEKNDRTCLTLDKLSVNQINKIKVNFDIVGIEKEKIYIEII